MKFHFGGERFHIRVTIPLGLLSWSVTRKGIAASIAKSDGNESEFTTEQLEGILKALAECAKQYKGLKMVEINSEDHWMVVEL